MLRDAARALALPSAVLWSAGMLRCSGLHRTRGVFCLALGMLQDAAGALAFDRKCYGPLVYGDAAGGIPSLWMGALILYWDAAGCSMSTCLAMGSVLMRWHVEMQRAVGIALDACFCLELVCGRMQHEHLPCHGQCFDPLSC